MTTESKSFFQKYWQAILIGISLNIIVGVVANIGAYKVVLYKLEENIKQDNVQGQSIFELQQNQIFMAAKENINLPNSYTKTRGGK